MQVGTLCVAPNWMQPTRPKLQPGHSLFCIARQASKVFSSLMNYHPWLVRSTELMDIFLVASSIHFHEDYFGSLCWSNLVYLIAKNLVVSILILHWWQSQAQDSTWLTGVSVSARSKGTDIYAIFCASLCFPHFRLGNNFIDDPGSITHHLTMWWGTCCVCLRLYSIFLLFHENHSLVCGYNVLGRKVFRVQQ